MWQIRANADRFAHLIWVIVDKLLTIYIKFLDYSLTSKSVCPSEARWLRDGFPYFPQILSICGEVCGINGVVRTLELTQFSGPIDFGTLSSLQSLLHLFRCSARVRINSGNGISPLWLDVWNILSHPSRRKHIDHHPKDWKTKSLLQTSNRSFNSDCHFLSHVGKPKKKTHHSAPIFSWFISPIYSKMGVVSYCSTHILRIGAGQTLASTKSSSSSCNYVSTSCYL